MTVNLPKILVHNTGKKFDNNVDNLTGLRVGVTFHHQWKIEFKNRRRRRVDLISHRCYFKRANPRTKADIK